MTMTKTNTNTHTLIVEVDSLLDSCEQMIEFGDENYSFPKRFKPCAPVTRSEGTSITHTIIVGESAPYHTSVCESTEPVVCHSATPTIVIEEDDYYEYDPSDDEDSFAEDDEDSFSEDDWNML